MAYHTASTRRSAGPGRRCPSLKRMPCCQPRTFSSLQRNYLACLFQSSLICQTQFLIIPGEAEAHRHFNLFAGRFSPTTSLSEGDDYRIFSYADTRNRMDLAGTSQLSPYLRFGMLSARQVVARALEASEVAPNTQARNGATSWLNELIWREFYISILYHFPHVRQRSFRPNYNDVPWDDK